MRNTSGGKLFSFLTGLLIGLTTVSHALARAPEVVVQLASRDNTVQSYWLLRGDSTIRQVLVLFGGGYGLLKLRSSESGIDWEPGAAEFLIGNRHGFLDDDTAVAIVDTPSDEWAFGLTPRFRKSDKHLADIRAVVADLKKRYPDARVFLLGNSMGSISAAYAGAALGKSVDGVVLSASVFEWSPASWRHLHDSNLTDFDFSRIQAPLLFVHHMDDKCIATPFSATQKIQGRYPLIGVRGGDPVRDNGCGPLGPHGYLGRENQVIEEIKHWVRGLPVNFEIR